MVHYLLLLFDGLSFVSRGVKRGGHGSIAGAQWRFTSFRQLSGPGALRVLGLFDHVGHYRNEYR